MGKGELIIGLAGASLKSVVFSVISLTKYRSPSCVSVENKSVNLKSFLLNCSLKFLGCSNVKTSDRHAIHF